MARNTKFKPGNPGGPGRPKGSKNKITMEYLDRLWDHFKEHGPDVLDRVCRDKPDVYLKLVASLIDRDWNMHHTGEQTINLVSFLDVIQDDLKSRQETFNKPDAPAKKLDS